jgi:predicted alpha/beta hydrolase family esterase
MKIENYIPPNLLDKAGGLFDASLIKIGLVVQNRLSKGEEQPKSSFEEKQLDFYFEKGFVDDPASFFSFPDKAFDQSVYSESQYRDGKRTVITYQTSYHARNPLLEPFFDRFPANRTGYVFHWQHGDKGRPTVLCLHGFGMGPPKQAYRMFRMGKLYDMGMDVALFITPFHWKRTPNPRLSGRYYLAPENPAVICENIAQTMYEIYGSILMLKERGAGPIGIIGASLGGYHSALFASLSDLPEFAVLVVPAVDLIDTARKRNYGMENPPGRELADKIEKVWSIHSPLSHELKLPKERVLIIAARGDRFCPFRHVKRLYEHWDNPPHHFLTGGHTIFFDRKSRGQAWYNFLEKVGFTSRT